MTMAIPVIPAAPTKEEPVLSVPSMLAGEWARDVIMSVAHNSPRSLQAHLGPSEIGQQCERRIAYRVLGTPYVNYPDPLKAMLGTGFHEVMAEGLARLDPRRYAVEIPVTYRGISGQLDVYDRYRKRVVDWKTSLLKRIRRYRREGIPVNGRVQIAIYAEGLRAAGEDVQETSLIYVPRDDELGPLYAWVGKPDKALADEYIDRYFAIEEKAREHGVAALPITATPLCKYCPNFAPRAVDLDHACPGGALAA